MTWRGVPLRHVTVQRRRVVDAAKIAEEVLHYSIPALEQAGRPQMELSTDIESHKLKVERDDVLVARLNPRKGRVTRVVDYLPGATVASTEFVPLVPEGIDGRFLTYLLQGETSRQQLDAQVQSVTRSHQRVDPESITHMRVRVPASDEQVRIANFLDDQVTRIDWAIAMREQQIEALKSQIPAAAHGHVAGTYLGDRESVLLPWSPTLPKGWRAVRLSTIARMGSGHTPSRGSPEYWVDCDIPWLTTGDVARLREDEVEELTETAISISELGMRNSAAVLHPAGTVALSRTASAGFSAVMGVPMATSQDYAVWRPSPHLIPAYLLWCLRAMRQDLLGRLAMGSTHKTIYFPDLESIRIPLPSLKEQEAAVTALRMDVTRIIATRAAVRRSRNLLQERKRALITAAVTGEFDVSSAGPRAAAAVIA